MQYYRFRMRHFRRSDRLFLFPILLSTLKSHIFLLYFNVMRRRIVLLWIVTGLQEQRTKRQIGEKIVSVFILYKG